MIKAYYRFILENATPTLPFFVPTKERSLIMRVHELQSANHGQNDGRVFTAWFERTHILHRAISPNSYYLIDRVTACWSDSK
jgi:hypothetical protein